MLAKASGLPTFLKEPLEKEPLFADTSPPVPELCRKLDRCEDEHDSCDCFLSRAIKKSAFVRPYVTECPLGMSFTVSPLILSQGASTGALISGYVRTEEWDEKDRAALERRCRTAGVDSAEAEELTKAVPVISEKRLRATADFQKRTSEYLMAFAALADGRFDDCMYCNLAIARQTLRKGEWNDADIVSREDTFDWREEKHLIEIVALGKRKAAEEKLDEIVTNMAAAYENRPEEFKGRVIELAVLITRTPYYISYSEGQPVNIRLPEFYPPKGFDKLTLKHWLKVILEEVMDIADSHAGTQLNSNVVRAAMGYIDSHLEEELRLEDVSNAMGFSARHLNRIFLEEIGINVSEYLLRARIQESKRLLRQSDMTVTEIAEKLNYWDSTHFAKMFRKTTGKSPSEYRRETSEL